MESSLLVAVIVPCFNEKENILQLITRVRSAVPQSRIYIVDDASPDGTAQLVKKRQLQDHRLFLINQAEKGGRGKAVLTGFKQALHQEPFDIFIEMDADLSHQSSELAALISSVSTKKIAIASRYLPQSKIVNWPLRRRFFSWFTNQVLRMILPFKLHDYTNGFRAYPTNAVKSMLNQPIKSSSYFVLSETAWILYKSGFKFVELPSVFVNRSQGKSKTNLKEVIHNLGELIILFSQKRLPISKKNT